MSDADDKFLERCPRCRMRREGFAIFRCPACGAEFCAGCDEPELSERGLGWLVAAVAESTPPRCPVCTDLVSEVDQIGVIASTRRGTEPA